MKIEVLDAQNDFFNLVLKLTNGEEDIIYISENGKTIAQLTPVRSLKTKRIGVAKNEMKYFDLSAEEFDDITISNFGAE